MLRPLHLFMRDWGGVLAPMQASFPAPQDLKQGDDSSLRWAVRSDGKSGFIFVNNYERFCQLSAKKDVQLEACGVTLPKLTIPSGAMAIFPVNVEGMRYATAQLVARRDGKIYLMQVSGIPVTISMADGKTLRNVKPRGTEKPVYKNLYLLTQQQAEMFGLEAAAAQPAETAPVEWRRVKEAGPLRTVKKGKARVAEAPSEEDWQQAAVYDISLPSSPYGGDREGLLSITYQGDCARLYADGKLVADNFQYGRPFLYGLWRLPVGCSRLELRILPLQSDIPIYLPREADRSPGERVKQITVEIPEK
jgi:hypothetical protein